MLCLTDDMNAALRCQDPGEYENIIKAMVALGPDQVALDAASPDLTNYPTAIGTINPGLENSACFARDPDPLTTLVPGLKRHGMRVLANVRMNDHHGREAQWAAWERAHPEWSLGVDTGARDWKSIGKLRCMDYAVEGVRSHRLAILREFMGRYDFDGIQLDFGRTPPFVSQPKTENGKWLTVYLREVRKLLDAQPGEGRKTLGAVVPIDPELCGLEGLQLETWIREGLIDFICPAEKYYADWNWDLRPWLELTAGSGCALVPTTPGNVSPFQDFEHGEISLLGENAVLDLPKLRALAAQWRAQGTTHFGLYNFYVFEFGGIYPAVRAAIDAELSRGQRKHFFYGRRNEYHYREYLSFDVGAAFRRHALMDPGESAVITFRFAPDPAIDEVTLRLAVKHLMPKDRLKLVLNEEPLDGLGRRFEVVQRFGRVHHAGFFEALLPASRLRAGLNRLRFVVETRAEFREPLEVGELEIWSGAD